MLPKQKPLTKEEAREKLEAAAALAREVQAWLKHERMGRTVRRAAFGLELAARRIAGVKRLRLRKHEKQQPAARGAKPSKRWPAVNPIAIAEDHGEQ